MIHTESTFMSRIYHSVGGSRQVSQTFPSFGIPIDSDDARETSSDDGEIILPLLSFGFL